MSELSKATIARVVDGEDGSSLIDRSLETIRKHLDMEVAYLSEFVDGRSVFRAVKAPGLEHLVSVGGSNDLKDVYCEHILEGRLPELIPDTSKEPVAAKMPITQAVPIGSHMSIPIRRKNGSAWGMFCCLSSKPNASLNIRDLEAMRIFANLAAEQVNDRIERESDLREKIERIEAVIECASYRMVYQPICDLVSCSPKGFESLCRFTKEPYRSPDIWFREAVEAGKARELEKAVITTAIEALDHLPEDVYLSVNASPETIVSGELETLPAFHAARRIVLEITEHAPVADYRELVAVLSRLRSRGIRLAIDDAGAGFASLQHIVQLSPDIIKLDMSLTRDIDSDPAKRSLASALIHFARETGAEIVAEGIETESELRALRTLGIGSGQGYFLGRPQEIAAAARLAIPLAG